MSEKATREISGKVLKKGEKWLTVNLSGRKYGSDYVLVNPYSAFLNAGDKFTLTVNSSKKHNDGKTKWFHVPVSSKEKPSRIVLGIGTDEMVLQPCIGNIIIKDKRAYEVKKCEKCSNGYSFGYFCEYWWKIVCIDITFTNRGKKAIKQQIE